MHTPIYPHFEAHVLRNGQKYFNPFSPFWYGKGRCSGRIFRALRHRERFYGYMNGQVISNRIPTDIRSSDLCDRRRYSEVLTAEQMEKLARDCALQIRMPGYWP